MERRRYGALCLERSSFEREKASSREEALEWFRAKDDSNIRAPDQSPANRMNAAGIRAFYGALQDRIAIAEKMQPSIGGHIVVGSFVPTRPLTVLDLGALGGEFEYADLFDPEFDGVSERLVFLRMLEQEISLPIQPAEDPEGPIGYVPTQIVAEYVHGVLSLDGLAYRSTQTGEAPSQGQLFGPRLGPTERNVVLFGGAALTTEEAGPEGVQAGLRLLPEPRQLVNVPAESTSLTIGWNDPLSHDVRQHLRQGTITRSARPWAASSAAVSDRGGVSRTTVGHALGASRIEGRPEPRRRDVGNDRERGFPAIAPTAGRGLRSRSRTTAPISAARVTGLIPSSLPAARPSRSESPVSSSSFVLNRHLHISRPVRNAGSTG